MSAGIILTIQNNRLPSCIYYSKSIVKNKYKTADRFNPYNSHAIAPAQTGYKTLAGL